MKVSKIKTRTIVIALTIYLIINILSITLIRLPMMTSFVFWGGIAPFSAIIFTWIILHKNINNKVEEKESWTTSTWVLISSMISLFFIVFGIASIVFISALWASI